MGIRVKRPVKIKTQLLYNAAILFLDTDPKSPMLIYGTVDSSLGVDPA